MILTLATMAEHAHNKAIITNVPAGEVTQESNVKVRTSQYVFLGKKGFSHSASFHPSVWIGVSEANAVGIPEMG